MANMSYCRYENTLSNLRDCYNAMQDAAEEMDPDDEDEREEELSEYEADAKRSLIALCATITEEFGEGTEG